MLARSRNRIGRAAAGVSGGVLLLGLVLLPGRAPAATAGGAVPVPAHASSKTTKADSLKAKQAAAAKKTGAAASKTAPVTAPKPKPASKAGVPASKPGVPARTAVVPPAAVKPAAGMPPNATQPAAGKPGSAAIPGALKSVATPAPAQKAKPTPPSRLATLPTTAPTRATAMPHPEALRAAVALQAAAQAKPARWSTTNPELARAAQTRNAPAGPRGAVTLSPAGPPAPVPMGIPAANPKLAAGAKGSKASDARIMAATAGGLAVVSGIKATAAAPSGKNARVPTGIPAGPEVSKMTVVGSPASSVSGKPTTLAAKAGPAGPMAHRGSVTPLPKTAEVRLPSVGAAKSSPVVTPTALEDQVTYQYNALGRRDPFNSLLEGDFVGDDVGGNAPPDLGGLKVVGIMWGNEDQFAMVEDVKGNSFVLRRGDKVQNGFVEGLKRDAMIVNITVDGQSQSVTVPITRKGEKSNANR